MFEMKSESGENRSQSAGETLQPLPNTRAATPGSATGPDPETQRIGSDGWLPSSRSRPCPVCSRTKDSDCRISADGEQVICHHPKDLVPGTVTNGWAFTKNTSDGRAGHFTIDKPRSRTTPLRSKVVPLRTPAPAAITLARLPQAHKQPPAHWPDGQKLPYGSDGQQWVKVVVDAKGKRHLPHHIDANGKPIGKAGPNPWPLWCEAMALEHGPGKWIVETEGEKCAAWLHAAALVAISQPGHDHKQDKIQTRYARLVAAGVAGVVYLADHDKTGIEKAHKCAAAAAAVNLPFVTVPAVEVWPGLAAGGSIDDAPGTAADRAAAFNAQLLNRKPNQQAQQAAPAGAPPNTASPLPEAPYRILGWTTKLDAVWVQKGNSGIVGSVPLSKAGLQRLAPISYWETLFPGRSGAGWDAAISNVHDAAEALGVFTPDRIRGRGVWLDNNRVVWHLGNRIEVNGQLMHLTELQATAFTYASLPALDINPEVAPLTDAEGIAILNLLHKDMKWDHDGDGLLLAGHTVLGNVCGALEIRPGVQYTGPTQAGKSTTERTIARPLQAGLALRTSGATEAGVRQVMRDDALPVVIDESEEENARQRDGHLHLLRLSFDGQQQVKGTPGGQALTYTMRSMITLIGINAAIPNPADRNRLVVIRPQKLQPDAWTQFQVMRDKLITIEAGRRLIRRTVSNLPALLANIKVFTAVLSSQKGSDRTHQVLGSLLAGAHHLTSTAVLDPDAALTWLDAVGWAGLDDEALDATSADAEARACLDHLLSYSVQWKGSQTGSITVLELLQIVKNTKSDAGDASAALGRLGIKWDRERELVVANSCKVFAGGKWANGNHRDHLLSLKGAEAVPSAVWFTGMGTKKGISLPLPA